MPPTSPAQWRDELNARIDERWLELGVYDAYYDGDQELAFITKKYRDAYGNFFRGLCDNWMPIVVDSAVERLRVQGFRFDNKKADDDAWTIWQANGCDAQASMVHTEAVKLGISYWMVQPDGEAPRITAEHPLQVITAADPADRRDRLAAFKKWSDGGRVYANVYLPDRITKYVTDDRSFRIERREAKWTTISDLPNPLGEVPIVPVPNKPTMLREGTSDLKGGAISIQNSINLLLSTQLVGAEYMAYPLRVMLGVDQPKDANGNPIPNAELKVAASRLLMFAGDAREMDVKELSAADLNNIRQAIDGLVRDLTAHTRTPPHYVLGQIVNASGDALKAAETGLVAKVRDKMDPMGEAHEEMIRLAFRSIDKSDPRGEASGCETIWKDPESRSQAETVDAAVKLSGIGVPQEALWERIGASPQEIDRWRIMQEEQALRQQAEQPAVAPARPGEGNGVPTPEQMAGMIQQMAQERPAEQPAP